LKKITAKEKKYIAMGAIVFVAALSFYGFSWLMENHATVINNVERQKQILAKQLEILNREASGKKQLDLYKKQLQVDKNRLLPSDNPNVASSDLGKIIENFANGSGVEITLKTPQQEKKIDDKLIRISVSIQVNCVLDQLVQFLTAIENHDKFLIVNELSIVSGYRSSILSAGGALQRKLNPTMIISGFINAPEAKPKPSAGI
jgi:hypothetical protein